jgi:hypothetical protein
LEKTHIEPVTTQWNNASPSRAGCVARYWVHSIGHARSLKNIFLVGVSSQNVGIEMLLKKFITLVIIYHPSSILGDGI